MRLGDKLGLAGLIKSSPNFPGGVKLGGAGALFLVIWLMPAPEGLTPAGQRALAVMALAVALWATEALPVSVTAILGVVLLPLLGAVPDVAAGLHGFSQPVVYFLIGILTMGLAVQRSRLAERLANLLIRGATGRPLFLYLQMLLSFALLTFALPSASTRGAILVHVYEQALARWGVEPGHRYYRALMLSLGSLNRLGSTALLAGGITPVVASGLMGDFSWTRWFTLMSVPFYANLIIGGAIVYFLYRGGFRLVGISGGHQLNSGPIRGAEYRAGAIVMVAALIWFTDFAHGLHPAAAALVAMVLILLPRIGVLSWREFEENLGWSNFFVIASSLSLANALVATGAAGWFSEALVGWVEQFRSQPWLALLALCVGCASARVIMPNIAGYLAVTIPLVMSGAGPLGLNPLVCGMAAVVVGDSAVYYGAGGASAVFIYQRAKISNPEILRLGLIMTGVAIGVLFTLVLPYWGWLGVTLEGQ